MTNIVFLEGPAFAGKTTFLRHAPGGVITLPEASEFLGSDAHFPAAPTDAATMVYCSYFFAVMENERLKMIGDAAQSKLVLADRFTPLSSMIFYALRHANGDIKTAEYEKGKRLSAALFSEVVKLPKAKARFIRFSLSSPEVLAARLPRGTRNSELASWQGAQFYASQYEALLPASTERAVDGIYQGNLQQGEWMTTEELFPRLIPVSSRAGEVPWQHYVPQPVQQEITTTVQTLIQGKKP